MERKDPEQGYEEYLSDIAAWLNGDPRKRHRLFALTSYCSKFKKVQIKLSKHRWDMLKAHANKLPQTMLLDRLADIRGGPTEARWLRYIIADFLLNGPIPPTEEDTSEKVSLCIVISPAMIDVLGRRDPKGLRGAARRLLEGHGKAASPSLFKEIDQLYPSYNRALTPYEVQGRKMYNFLSLVGCQSDNSIQTIATIRKEGIGERAKRISGLEFLSLYLGELPDALVFRAIMATDILNSVIWPNLPKKAPPGTLRSTISVRVSPVLYDAMLCKVQDNALRLDMGGKAGASTALRYAFGAGLRRHLDSPATPGWEGAYDEP